ncbi:MAG: IS3 family transposase, partial [Chloroflexi bacterium]|nr:IS3 family transposase [Chloroflexota bacterium]
PKCERALGDEVLGSIIAGIHQESRHTYGAPRVHAELRLAKGIRVGRKRVARLMRLSGLAGVHRRRRPRTTIRGAVISAVPDLVGRDFTVDRPDRLWIADITYIRTDEGFLYLAVVLDACTRRIVGWSMRRTLETEIVTAALDMAIARRSPAAGLVFHSDHGSQYTSFAFGHRCREAGIAPSMGAVGSAYDNAMAESFFASLECELLDRSHFDTREQARVAVFDYLEAWYNPRRRHSSIGYASPAEFDRRFAELALT